LYGRFRKPTGREAAGDLLRTRHLVVVLPTPYGVGLVRAASVRPCKPTGREAAGDLLRTRHLVVVLPTPYGVGLVRAVQKADRP
jgi:hypothetical protein